MDREEHPTPAAIASFIRGEAPIEVRLAIVRHLLTGCEKCLVVTRTLWYSEPNAILGLASCDRKKPWGVS